MNATACPYCDGTGTIVTNPRAIDFNPAAIRDEPCVCTQPDHDVADVPTLADLRDDDWGDE